MKCSRFDGSSDARWASRRRIRRLERWQCRRLKWWEWTHDTREEIHQANGKQARQWICSSKTKRWDRAQRLLQAVKTLRAYVECTSDVITKKSPCCSKQLQSLIHLLFHLVLTHQRRPNPWHRGTDHSVTVISNQSRPSKIWNWRRTKGAKMGSKEGLRVVKDW